MKHAFYWLALLVGLALLAGCGAPGAQAGIVVEEAWLRPPPLSGGNGAAYLVIHNRGDADDTLLSVRAELDVQAVELHQTVTMEAGDGTGGEMMGMQPLSSLDVPAGARVALEPGGYHIMLVGVQGTLEPGQRVRLWLTFERAGEVEVEAEVRPD